MINADDVYEYDDDNDDDMMTKMMMRY